MKSSLMYEATSATTLNGMQPLSRFDSAEASHKDHISLIYKQPCSGFNVSRF